jgi:hypothetical protein
MTIKMMLPSIEMTLSRPLLQPFATLQVNSAEGKDEDGAEHKNKIRHICFLSRTRTDRP